MKITLYFGSFNPVHTGHMIIANHLINATDTDQVWMVISPQSPFKKKDNLADSYDRLHFMELAIGTNEAIKSCNIEFELPVPSYTIDTLTYLKERYPENDFSIVMGSDNVGSFNRWKNYEMILEHYFVYIYQRPGSESDLYKDHPSVHYLDGPLLDISSSFIRKLIREGKSIRYLVSENVFDYLEESNMYK